MINMFVVYSTFVVVLNSSGEKGDYRIRVIVTNIIINSKYFYIFNYYS